MPSWRDKMGPATFRGIPFHVSVSERTGGRRNVRHEYPLKDDPFFEDMGRKPRSFPVEGYVLGSDYLAARDALLDALEQAGPGELVHPYHGTRRVVVEDFRVREMANEGGIAVFSIEFSETPAIPLQPSTTVDSATQVGASASITRDALSAEFSATYEPGTLLDSVEGLLRSATRAISGVIATLTSDEQTLATLRSDVDSFAAAVAAVARTPSTLLSNLTAFFAGLTSRVACLSVYAFDPGLRPTGTTPDRILEQRNFDATQRLIQRLAVTRAAEIAATETFTSFEDAVAARSAITDLLDEQMEIAADDVYPSLLQLRADLVEAVPGEGSDLAHLVSFTPQITVPSLVLAHRLYGNLDREADIIARNRIRKPGFVPGGSALEILSDD